MNLSPKEIVAVYSMISAEARKLESSVTADGQPYEAGSYGETVISLARRMEESPVVCGIFNG